MKGKSVEQVKKEIAVLDRLLADEDIEDLPLYNVPVKRGLELLAVLKDKLRPFIVRYTALVNRNQEYVAVDTAKLQEYVELAEELSQCEEVLLFMRGVAYNHALKLIINGFEDAEEAVQMLYATIKITEDAEGTIRLFTQIEESGFNGVNVEKDEDAE